jgi:hypothetical protein
MALKMRPTGLGSGFYKDDVDYSVFCGEWCIGRIYEKRSGPRLALRFNTKGCPQTERRAPAGVIQPAG